jgi:hypothetical protein
MGHLGQWMVGSGLTCAVMMVVGMQIVAPLSGTVAGICELFAVAAGVVFVGLLDGE